MNESGVSVDSSSDADASEVSEDCGDCELMGLLAT
jgi:hypothetical protein